MLIVDDHTMMREGLRSVLEGYDDIEIVGEATNGMEAIEQVVNLMPSVVVMDINMPGMNGIEATERIKKQYPNVTVVGLSVNAEKDNHDAMTRAGAAFLLTKEAAVERLYSAIKTALTVPSHDM